MMKRTPPSEEGMRPRPPQSSRSFTRYEPLPSSSSADTHSEASRAQVLPSSPSSILAPPAGPERSHSDVFEAQDDIDNDGPSQNEAAPDDAISHEDFEELPIEIRTLVERFLESLPLRSQSMPIDQMADHFQAFYAHAQTHLNTHIAAQQSKLARGKSPSPSVSSMNSNSSRSRTRRSPALPQKEPLQQMLTAEEVSDRKKARRKLEQKRIWIEEAIERHVCEQAYNHIWANSASEDVTRDAKLKSRAAALALVGVDLQELLSTALPKTEDRSGDFSEAKRDAERFSEARHCLHIMNDARYPQAKVQALAAVHKEIVDALQQFYPTSSSADEILPTLIFVVISSHPESLNLVSDLLFVQRFRNIDKLGGEAAYCLTNLEAAIGFLETVDLSSLRSSEAADMPLKGISGGVRPSTPRSEPTIPDPMFRGLPLSPQQQPQTPSPRHSRRLSSLIGSRPQPLPGAVIAQADNAIDAIHTALDSSFSFLFGRMREKQLTAQSPGFPPDVAAPKTLEEARKLVTETSGLSGNDEPDGILNDIKTAKSGIARDADVLTLVGGRRAQGEGAARSSEAHSYKKSQATAAVATSDATHSEHSFTNTNASGATAAAMASGYAAVESMRTFGDSLNPFKSFSVRGFGLPGSSSVTTAGNSADASDKASAWSHVDKASATTLSAEPAREARAIDVSGIGGPIERFVDLKDARELNFYDVELLLRDYQRLAGVLKVLQS